MLNGWVWAIDPKKPTMVGNFDWLTFVIPDVPLSEINNTIRELLMFPEAVITDNKNGIYFYDSSKNVAGNSIIAGFNARRDDRDDHTEDLMIQISGGGLDTIRQNLDNSGFSELEMIEKIREWDGHFTRVDANYDFFNFPYQFSPMYFDLEFEKGHVLSDMRYKHAERSYDLPDLTGISYMERFHSAELGYTFYIGKNPKQVRNYNKKAERRSKMGIEYPFKSWYRWEYQLNGEHAENFINDYIENGYDDTFFGWIAGDFRFVDKPKNSKTRTKRCPTAKWFADLIDGYDAIKHTKIRKESTLDTTAQWIERQVIPSLATLVKGMFYKYVDNGVAPEDAERMAKDEAVIRLIDEAIQNENQNEGKAIAYAKEHLNEHMNFQAMLMERHKE